ncbi:hypothetical protein PanWU01x14_261150 [Parasponia andersonii]|uniref:Uncharacterized protein n=1 Tax=Parasponia andersonii TaxID=3476 RepID=A0A2P5B8P1_PARAD|nr:hypothetical protein PanWU01x14_261150 [Parasponia andersonii]
MEDLVSRWKSALSEVERDEDEDEGEIRGVIVREPWSFNICLLVLKLANDATDTGRWDFKYERLSEFCFVCGGLLVDCLDVPNYRDTILEGAILSYGSWHRGTPTMRLQNGSKWWCAPSSGIREWSEAGEVYEIRGESGCYKGVDEGGQDNWALKNVSGKNLVKSTNYVGSDENSNNIDNDEEIIFGANVNGVGPCVGDKIYMEDSGHHYHAQMSPSATVARNVSAGEIKFGVWDLFEDFFEWASLGWAIKMPLGEIWRQFDVVDSSSELPQWWS